MKRFDFIDGLSRTACESYAQQDADVSQVHHARVMLMHGGALLHNSYVQLISLAQRKIEYVPTGRSIEERES